MAVSPVARTSRAFRQPLVASLRAAVENISRYQAEVRDEQKLAKEMRRARVWYGVRSEAGAWLFAPSKFVGYAGNSGRAYVSERDDRNGGLTEKVLKRWFKVVPHDTHLGAALDAALHRFLAVHGHSGPGRNARICVPRALLEDRDGATRELRDRIRVDPSICGGRPHIRGTRVRVMDILDLLASGVAQSDILADYPYLTEADLRAALAFGAAASGHRVILTAGACSF